MILTTIIVNVIKLAGLENGFNYGMNEHRRNFSYINFCVLSLIVG